jgi:hypothetical protein
MLGKQLRFKEIREAFAVHFFLDWLTFLNDMDISDVNILVSLSFTHTPCCKEYGQI